MRANRFLPQFDSLSLRIAPTNFNAVLAVATPDESNYPGINAPMPVIYADPDSTYGGQLNCPAVPVLYAY